MRRHARGQDMEESTNEGLDRKREGQDQAYATLGRRLVAFVLDLTLAVLAAMIPTYIAMRLLIGAGVWDPAAGDTQRTWHLSGVGAKLSVFIAYLLSTGPIYHALFESSDWQATIGKRLMHIRLTGRDGQRIGIGRSIGRSVAGWAVGLSWGALVSAVIVVVTAKHRAIHDLMAGTEVLYGRAEGRLEPWRIVISFGLPFAWMLGTLFLTL